MTNDNSVKRGECDFCLEPDLELCEFDNEIMCLECREERFNQQQLEASELEDCLKYEAEDWVPEDGFDEED